MDVENAEKDIDKFIAAAHQHYLRLDGKLDRTLDKVENSWATPLIVGGVAVLFFWIGLQF